MIFADIDANGWVAIIGAVFLGLGNLILTAIQMILSYLRDRDTKAKVADVKSEVGVVKSLANGQNDTLRAERDKAQAELKAIIAALPPGHPALPKAS